MENKLSLEGLIFQATKIKVENNVRINPMTYLTKSNKKSGIYSGGSVVLEHSKWLKHITIQKKEFDD